MFDLASKASDAQQWKVTWSLKGTLLVGVTGGAAATAHLGKIAGFDFDDTITCPKGTTTFSKSADDWRFVSPNVVPTMQRLAATHRVVVFSNQKNLLEQGNKAKEAIFKGKVQAVARQLQVPLLVFAATENDGNRKPRVGMWETFLRDHHRVSGGGAAPIDLAASFYVGDAAGRPAVQPPGSKKPTRKKDHSDGDLKFAQNVGVRHMLPEELYDGDTAERARVPTRFGFNPATYVDEAAAMPLYLPSSTPLALGGSRGGVDVVVCTGAPGCGKTTFVKTHLVAAHGYVHVNQDTLKTRERCVAAMEAAIGSGRSVVVDNTCPAAVTRALYASAARAAGAKTVRSFWFVAPEELCRHNAAFRAVWTAGTDDERGGIPDVVYRTFYKNLEPPDARKEGLTEVKKINFVPSFASPEVKERWSKWYV
ncbi:polynucleotide kinase 3 phosphatase-domain-containing protein [Zopfochytrium polystomum]|nr:polynucleotide kinase 3 phosphatase-domain-containing protein [Zopfochytrium polystomum]